MRNSRVTFEALLDARYPAERSIVLRYRQGLASGLSERERAPYMDWLGRASLAEGARIVGLLEYRGVQIHVLDETSLMHTGSLKSIDGCVTAAHSRLEDRRAVAFESGGNTGMALSAYGRNLGLETFCFVPEENLSMLDGRLFDNERAHLIAVRKPSLVKPAVERFEMITGIPRVPRKEWRDEASRCRGFFILESILGKGEYTWLAQTVSAGFGPIGVYGVLSAFGSGGMTPPRFLGVQQEANCPMYRSWKGLAPLRDGGAVDSTAGLLNRIMYDRRPETYGTYRGLSRVLRESRGDLITVNRPEFERVLDDPIEGMGIVGLLEKHGIHLWAREGEIVDGTGLTALAGTLKHIDAGMIAPKSKVLCCLTSGAGRADGKAKPEASIASEADVDRLFGQAAAPAADERSHGG